MQCQLEQVGEPICHVLTSNVHGVQCPISPLVVCTLALYGVHGVRRHARAHPAANLTGTRRTPFLCTTQPPIQSRRRPGAVVGTRVRVLGSALGCGVGNENEGHVVRLVVSRF